MAKRKSRKRDNKRADIGHAGIRNTRATDETSPSGVARPRTLPFVVIFAVFCIGLYAAIQALPLSFTQPINVYSAMNLSMLLNLIGVPAVVSADKVSSGGFTLQVIPECTPVYMIGLFICFIICSPATAKQKMSGLAMGIPVLYLGNMLRLVAIFMVGRYNRNLFDVVHAFWGQVFTMGLVMLTCILGMKSIDHEKSKHGIPMKAADFLARFTLISGFLFVVWMKVHHRYIWLLDQFTVPAFSLFNYHFNFTQNTVVYYETFSIVTFTSLVLAARSISWVLKIKALAIGLGFLFLTHLFHRIDNALVVYFNFTAAQTTDLTLLVIGQYLLPMLFLIYLTRRQKKECSV